MWAVLREETWVGGDMLRVERNPAVHMAEGKGLSSHLAASLASFWIILATDNELLSLHLEKQPVGHALFWDGGYKQKQDVVITPKESAAWRCAS